MNNSNDHSLPNVEDAKLDAAVLQDTIQFIDSKGTNTTRLRRQKRTILFAGVAAVAVAVIVGLSVTLSTDKQSQKELAGAPTTTETDAKLESYIEVLMFLSDETDLRTAGTPQRNAATWLCHDDAAKMPLPESTTYADSFAFFQRYIVAVLYGATHGPTWTMQMKFLSSNSVCDWHLNGQDDNSGDDISDQIVRIGVSCNADEEVTQVFIPNNGLIGSLPAELGFLLALENLSLFGNNVTDTIPDTFANLESLRFMSLEKNQLTGKLPTWLHNDTLPNLRYLTLANNMLTGTVEQLAAMPGLTQVALHHNLLEGSISHLTNLPNLETLFVQDNQLTGTLDDTFLSGSDPLRVLDLSDNQIVGTMPSWTYDLEIFDVHDNDLTGKVPEAYDGPMTFLSCYGNQISGSLPNTIARLINLEHLDVSNNAITGPIPTELGQLSDLVFLFLSNNNFTNGRLPYLNLNRLQELSLRKSKLTGKLPYNIADDLPQLRLVDLSENDLTGTIPTSMNDLAELRFLLLNRNRLSGAVPDLGGLSNLLMMLLDKNDLTGDLNAVCNNRPVDLQWLVSDCHDEVVCSCCTTCCADDDITCNKVHLLANIDDGYVRDEYVFSENLVFEST